MEGQRSSPEYVQFGRRAWRLSSSLVRWLDRAALTHYAGRGPILGLVTAFGRSEIEPDRQCYNWQLVMLNGIALPDDRRLAAVIWLVAGAAF